MATAMAERSTPSYDRHVLDFEKPIVDLERKIEELKQLTSSELDFTNEIRKLEKEIFADLTPWQKVQLSRHPGRPYTLDYLSYLFEDFVELHGDRAFADD